METKETITCKCNNVFEVEKARNILYYPNTPSKFETGLYIQCPKCKLFIHEMKEITYVIQEQLERSY